MSQTVALVGIEPAELRWIRMFVTLLRHPDPVMSELARQAVLYLLDPAKRSNPSEEGYQIAENLVS